MKSLFQQASTVAKAIEKAWERAGNPGEFTVKIIDFGKKNFLGLTKKPAIVSITYESEKKTFEDKKGYRKQEFTKKYSSPRDQKRVEDRRPQQRVQNDPESWQGHIVKDVDFWLRDWIKIAKISSRYKITTNKKEMKISFQDKVLQKNDDEKLLFSSLSYLLIQFIKKKYKKKFQGYYILLTSGNK